MDAAGLGLVAVPLLACVLMASLLGQKPRSGRLAVARARSPLCHSTGVLQDLHICCVRCGHVPLLPTSSLSIGSSSWFPRYADEQWPDVEKDRKTVECSRFEHPVFSQDHAAVITYLDSKASRSTECTPRPRMCDKCVKVYGQVGDLLARLKALNIDKDTLVTRLVSRIASHAAAAG